MIVVLAAVHFCFISHCLITLETTTRTTTTTTTTTTLASQLIHHLKLTRHATFAAIRHLMNNGWVAWAGVGGARIQAILELVGQEFRQSWSWSSLALLWVLHWSNCGSLSVGSLGSWSWYWCWSWSWWGLLGLGWLVGLGGVWMFIVADMMKLTRHATFAASQHLIDNLWMLGLG
jgi:hypothetical protein